MCRFTVYKGRPILIGDIVIKPQNSLVFQSRNAAYHPGVLDKCNKRNILVNGDGFGIAWYGEDLNKGSCCFKIVTPAWSDVNLRNIGNHVYSSLIFAHIRAASSGHDPHEPVIISNQNCHPFTFKNYTFMHNGAIPYFNLIKLKLLNLLSHDIYCGITGTTDSEHIFALFLNCLYSNDCTRSASKTLKNMIDSLSQTIAIISSLCAKYVTCSYNEYCSLNICITDGTNIIATRYREGPTNPPSLYYNFGSNFIVTENGDFYANNNIHTSTSSSSSNDNQIKACEVVISSAPLSKVFESDLVESLQDETTNTTTTTTSATTINSMLLNPPAQTPEKVSANYNCSPIAEESMEDHCHTTTTSTSCDEDSIGSWILIPKNHMLICRGNIQQPQFIESVYLESIQITSSTSYSYNNNDNNTISNGYNYSTSFQESNSADNNIRLQSSDHLVGESRFTQSNNIRCDTYIHHIDTNHNSNSESTYQYNKEKVNTESNNNAESIHISSKSPRSVRGMPSNIKNKYNRNHPPIMKFRTQSFDSTN